MSISVSFFCTVEMIGCVGPFLCAIVPGEGGMTWRECNQIYYTSYSGGFVFGSANHLNISFFPIIGSVYACDASG